MEEIKPDWLMVVITSIYVIATCFICYFNAKTVKTSQEQHEDNKKHKDLPWIHITIESIGRIESGSGSEKQISPIYCDDTDAHHFPNYLLKLCIRNIGRGPATQVSYTWDCPQGLDGIPSLYVNKALMSGESIKDELIVDSCVPSTVMLQHGLVYSSAEVVFEFTDICKRHYKQVFSLMFVYNGESDTMEADIDEGLPMETASWKSRRKN